MRQARRSTIEVPGLLARQRKLLVLLDAIGGSAGRLDFQKILFLYCEEPWSGRPYDFVPFKFGAFSFTSYADRRNLIEQGLLEDDDQVWQITDDGRRAVGSALDVHLAEFARRINGLRGDALVAETYRRFPFYATRSEVTQRVLHGDHEALARIEAARRTETAPAVLTIGYEGRTIESYLDVLLRSGVTTLLDVRRNPISRKYGFSKRTLSRSCEKVGIRYEHLPELGIPSEDRKGLNSQADYDALFADYERRSLPRHSKAVERIAQWVRRGERVALTCFERLPQRCHRHCVANAVQRRLDCPDAPIHL